MLSKLQNPKVGYISRLLLLPLLIILFTAFAIKIKENDLSTSIPRLEKELTVVIDAGHGFRNGTRHGALGLNGISEDEIALAITKKIEQLNTDKNLKLIFTRKDENFIDNKERVKIVEENNADLLISIHASFAPPIKKDGKNVENPANGFELYIPKDGTANLPNSRELGSAIVYAMKNVMTIREPAIKQREVGIWIIKAVPCPAVLLECGFISNSKDLAFLTNEKNQEKIAEAVLKGIVNYAKENTKSHQNTIEHKNNDTIPENKHGQVFTKAEVMPIFPGGENAWNRYIEKQLQENIQALITEGKEGTCDIAFIVNTEGFISDLTVKSMQNTKLASVFLEALKEGPKWIPAIQNGRQVVCWQTKKLTFRLPTSTHKQTVTIANANMKTLYIGMDNPLVISGLQIPENQVKVSSSNGMVTNINNTWIVRPNSVGKATITISDLNGDNRTDVDFIVKNIPDPAVTIADSRGGRIAANKITLAKQLSIDEEWEITNYTIYFTGKGFDEPFFVPANKTPEFNQRVLEAIAKCQPGTTIIIDEIHAKMKKSEIKTKPAPLAFNLY